MTSRIGLLILLPSLLAAQATVEHALGSAAAAGAAAPARSTGKAIGAALDKVSRTLDAAAKSGTAKPQVTEIHRVKQNSALAKPALADDTKSDSSAVKKIFENPSLIREGMDYEELLSRFGPPSMKVTSGVSEERLCYDGAGTSFDVQIRAAKVVSVQSTRVSDRSLVVSIP